VSVFAGAGSARSGTPLAAYIDTATMVAPRDGCSLAAPSVNRRVGSDLGRSLAHLKPSASAVALRCRFRSRYGYLGLSGSATGTTARITRVVAFDFISRNGQKADLRAMLSMPLAGTNTKLSYNRKACRRIALTR
jgi:hypothetical protein